MRAAWPIVVTLVACDVGEKQVAHFDGPRHVEVWQDGQVSGGEWPSYSKSCELHIDGVVARPAIPCGKVELVENPRGDQLAYRVAGKPWTLLRIGAAGVVFADCDPPNKQAAKFEFARVDPLSTAARRIVTCSIQQQLVRPSTVIAALAVELRGSVGPDAAAGFMVELGTWLPDPLETDDGNSDDPFTDVFWTALDADLRARVQARFCTHLLDPTASPTIYARAARSCPLDTAGGGSEARVRATATFVAEASVVRRGSAAADLDRMVFEWAVAIGLHEQPAEIGAVACTFLSTLPDDRDPRVDVAALALAISRVKCPAVTAVLANLVRCDDDYLCDGHPCAAKQVDTDAAAAFAAMAGPGPRRRFGFFPSSEHAILAAAYAQGRLPSTFATRLARKHYAVALQHGPSCELDGAPHGACTCELDAQTDAFCGLPLDGTYQQVPGTHCEVRADDRKALILGARRVPDPAAPGAPSALPPPDLAGESLGPLHPGLAASAVQALLGKPTIPEPPVKEEALGMYAVTWVYPTTVLSMTGRAAKGPWSVNHVTVSTGSKLATRAGIHPGSTRAEVMRAYPAARAGSDTELFVGSQDPGNWGIAVTLADDRVSAIEIGIFGF